MTHSFKYGKTVSATLSSLVLVLLWSISIRESSTPSDVKKTSATIYFLDFLFLIVLSIVKNDPLVNPVKSRFLGSTILIFLAVAIVRVNCFR